MDGRSSYSSEECVEENPYAPSKADLTADAPAARGWELRGGELWVQSGALLPMVDLYSGETADRMTLMRIGLRRRIRWHLFLFLGGLGSFVLLGLDSPYRGTVIDLSVLGLLIGAGMKAFSRVAVVQIFLARETSRRLQMQRLRVLALVGLAVAGAILAGSIDVVPWQQARFETLVTGVLLLLISASAVMWMRRKVLYYRERSGDAFLVRGVHPEAIQMLAEMADRPLSRVRS